MGEEDHPPPAPGVPLTDRRLGCGVIATGVGGWLGGKKEKCKDPTHVMWPGGPQSAVAGCGRSIPEIYNAFIEGICCGPAAASAISHNRERASSHNCEGGTSSMVA